MMRVLILLFAYLPLFGLSNCVTPTDQSGSDQTNRTWVIPRWFAQGEIAQNPRPYIAAVSATFWQTHVRTRWVDGSVQTALIVFEHTVSASSSFTVCFESDAADDSGGADMTKQEMLDFTPGGGGDVWGRKIRLVLPGGINQDASARTMLTNDHYRVLSNGPHFAEILIREDPQSVAGGTTRTTSIGGHCLTDCSTAPYDLDAATWEDPGANTQYDSIRPSFFVRFYRRWDRMEIDSLIENSWLDRRQDLRFRLQLFNGPSEDVSLFDSTNEAFFGAGMAHPETQWEGGAPAATKIDLNKEYLIYSKLMPNTDSTIGSAAVTLEVTDFNATDQGAFLNSSGPHMGWGQILRGMNSGGTRGELSLFARWDIRYLLTFDPALLDVVLGNATALFHVPAIRQVENNTGLAYDSGDTVEKFGRFVSRDARPSFQSGPAGGTIDGPDQTTEVGTVQCFSASSLGPELCTQNNVTNNTGNQWQPDVHHYPPAGFVAYLVTGKPLYLELQQAVAHWYLAISNNGNSRTVGGWRDKAILTINPSVRFPAWGFREIGRAAVISWDGTAEKAYLLEKLRNNLQIWEGKWQITDGYSTLPGDQSCTGSTCSGETNIWRNGKCCWEAGESNPLRFGIFADNQPLGISSAISPRSVSNWMHDYLRVVAGHLRDLGLIEWNRFHEESVKLRILMARDSTWNPYSGFEYMIPNRNSGDTGYITTLAGIENGFIRTAKLSKDIGTGDTSLILTASDNGNDQIRNTMNAQVLQIGSEQMLMSGSNSGVSKTISGCDAGLDRLTVNGHNYVAGQFIFYRTSGTPHGGLANITEYSVLSVVDSNTITLSGIDLTCGGSGTHNLWTHVVSIARRGVFDTTAAAHSAGATATRLAKVVANEQHGDPEGGFVWYARSALALATDYDVTAIDQGNGATLTARSAYEWVTGVTPNRQRLGSNAASCSGLTHRNCDNPQWAWVPRVRITNVRITAANNALTFRYNVSDGRACKVAAQTAAFASSDDSGDTTEAGGSLERSIQVGGLGANTLYNWRISCGSARLSGTARTRI